MGVREDFENYGWEAPRTQAAIANLVADDSPWTEERIRDAAWLLDYLHDRREDAVRELNNHAEQLHHEHRAVTRRRSEVAEPWEIKTAALRERMEVEFERAEPAEALLADVGLSIASTWKGAIADKAELLSAILRGELEGVDLDAVTIKQSALDAYARRVKHLRATPGLEATAVRQVRRLGRRRE